MVCKYCGHAMKEMSRGFVCSHCGSIYVKHPINDTDRWIKKELKPKNGNNAP